ncbi:MAG: putative methyltransferase [Cyanobacteria bacterium RYN_339]|nr:putative methyltransferase [Cyanobacteria bacterium RYN_339]
MGADLNFWAAAAPLIFASGPDTDALVALLALPAGGRVLEHVGGLGRHALDLASKGFAVTVRGEAGLEQARAAFEAAGLEAQVEHGDPRRSGPGPGYDAVIGLQAALGTYEENVDDLVMLMAAHKDLKPGGALLLRLRPRGVVPEGVMEQDYLARGELDLLEERCLPAGSDVQGIRWVLHTGDRRFQAERQVRLFEWYELHGLLSRAGFADVRFFLDLAGTAYHEGAPRMVALARRGM